MKDSSLPQNPPGPMFVWLEKMHDLDKRLERVENHLHLDFPAEIAEPDSPALFAPAVFAPVVSRSPHPIVPIAAAPDIKAPETAPPIPPSIATPIAWLPDSRSQSESPAESASKPAFSLGEWENLIGGKWALWIGSLCLFLAMASFLAYTWRSLPPAPPWAKVAMGLCSGFALLVAGGWLRPRVQRTFSEGISGAGLSICYLSLWAGGQYFSVFSQAQSFCGMALLTALGVFLAVRTDALSLIVLSTLGGFLTPVVMQRHGAGSGHSLTLLGYVAFLDAGILAVSLGKQWRGTVYLSFAGTILLVGGWALGTNIDALRAPSFGFLSAYFLLFLGASSFGSLVRREETAPEDLLLLFANTSLYALAGYSLIQPVTAAFPSAFPLVLSAFFGLMNPLVARVAPRNLALRNSAGGLALLGLTIAVPLQFHQAAFTIGWATEAAILLFLSGRLNSPILRRAGQIVWLLTSIPLLGDLTTFANANSGFFSAAAFPLAVCVAVSAFLAGNARHRAKNGDDSDELEAFYAAFAVLGGAYLLHQEIFHFFGLHHAPNSRNWTPNAYFAVADALAIYAWLVFTLGLRWRHQKVRFCALAVATLAAVTVVAIAFYSPTATHIPLWNGRFLGFALVGGVLALLTRFLKDRNEALSETEISIADVWMIATTIFWLAGASRELFLSLSGARAAPGAQPLETTIFALSILWSLAAALLLFLGFRWRQMALRALAWGLGSCALVALLGQSLDSALAGVPLFNPRFAAFAVALISLQLASVSLRRSESEISGFERRLPAVFRFVMLGLLLWTLTQESIVLSHYSRAVLGDNWGRWAQMLVSLVWSLFGALLLGGGIGRRDQSLRLAALELLAGTVVKVFVFDLGFLSGPSRVFSLGGLGVSLIFISFLYNRFGSEKISSGAEVSDAI